MEKQKWDWKKKDGEGLKSFASLCVRACVCLLFSSPSCVKGFVIRIEMMVGRGRIEIGCWFVLREREW
jgi:hypothetical protein